MKPHVTFESQSSSDGECNREYSIASDELDAVSIAEHHDRMQRELDYELYNRKEWDEIKQFAVTCVVLIAVAAAFVLIFS